MSYRAQQSVVTCIFSWFHKWALQPAVYWYHDDTACGTWNSLNIACMWSQWALVCADIQQYIIMDYPSSKLNTVLGVPFFHFHSPFYSYIWGLLTSVCLFSKHTCRAGKQPCPCPVEWDLRSTRRLVYFASSKNRLGLYCSPLLEGSHQCHSRADGLRGSSTFSTTLGIFTWTTGEGGPSYSDLHAKWTRNRSIFCSAAWAREVTASNQQVLVATVGWSTVLKCQIQGGSL